MNSQDDASDSDYPAQNMVNRPWIHLETTHDVEAWISNYDWELRRFAAQAGADRAGICFCLAHGGEILLHTSQEEGVQLELSPEAEWVAPVVSAATGLNAPAGLTWKLPDELLTQLVLGISGLIESSRPTAVIKVRQRVTW
jgi:hypothetical protein